MRKIKTLWERFISKLKIWQTAIIALLFLLLSIGLYSHFAGVPMNRVNFCFFLICLLCFLYIFMVFLFSTVNKLFDKSYEREERKALKKIQQMLNGSYKKVKYESYDTESLVTRLKTQAVERVGLELYARLDEKNNICFVYKDEKGNNVTNEMRTINYSGFLNRFTIDE